MEITRQSYTEYIRTLEIPKLDIVAHLLSTVSYSFSDNWAQVVLCILHKSFDNVQMQEASVALQRIIMLLSAYIHSKRYSSIIPQVTLVPHKNNSG